MAGDPGIPNITLEILRPYPEEAPSSLGEDECMRRVTKFPGSAENQQQMPGLGRAQWTCPSTAAPCVSAGHTVTGAVGNDNQPGLVL